MRNRNFWKLAMGLGLLGIPFAGGCLQESSPQAADTGGGALAAATVPVVYEANTAPDAKAEEPGTLAAAEPPALTNLAEAKIQPLSTNQPVPAKVNLSPAAAELAKLAGSGVDQGVMLAYVTNSQSVFNLSAEEIIYLNDLGVPGTVVTAMIQRDQVLKEQGKNALLSSSPPVTSLPAPVPAPAPVEAAPQVAPASEYPTEPPPTPPVEEATYATFYDSLAPYGTWVYVSGYGRCWRPTVVVVNPSWQPYFDSGHWVYTDCGWYWMSDYSWGWAPFHYGRWFRHGHWGWCWAPDTVWGPSWVSWRYSDAYCGWAPLPPGAYFSFSIGLTWHGHHVRDWDDCGLHASHYRFVGWRHFDDHRVHAYAVPPHEVNNIYRNTMVVNRITVNNNTVINQGIPRDRVASGTGRNIRQVAVRSTSNSDRPVTGRGERLSGNTLTVYRPAMPQRATESGTRQARGAVSTGGSAGSAISAPLAERAAGGTTRPVTAPSRGGTASRDTAAPSRGTSAPNRNQPPVVVNNSSPAPAPSAGNVRVPARNETVSQGSGARPIAPSRQSTAGAGIDTRPSPPTRAPAPTAETRSGTSVPAAQRTTPSAPQTVTAPPASTWRNADPSTRFDRVQPPVRSTPAPAYTPPSSRSAAPTYSAPAQAREVPRYTPAPAPQRSYTPAPSSRPESAPSRSYSAPSAPARSYSPPSSAPAPARSYSPPASTSRSDSGSRSSSSSDSRNSGGGRQQR